MLSLTKGIKGYDVVISMRSGAESLEIDFTFAPDFAFH